MEFFKIIILGIVQGLTEFLPVSSSGHLVIFQQILGYEPPGILLEVILHVGTLMAVIFYYWKDLTKINKQTLFFITLASIPAGIVGILFNNTVGGYFESLKLVGIALILTSLFNFCTDTTSDKNKKLTKKSALIIGAFQALAIIPGISRSGSTIFAGVSTGLNRKEAARFSFILSIPVVLGANLFEISNNNQIMIENLGLYFVGMLASFISGIFAIKILLKLLEGKSFKFFAFYAFVVGLFILLI